MGVPLALAVITAAHPVAHHDGPAYVALAPVLGRWMLVHLLQLIFLPLLALVVIRLAAASTSAAARVARVALLVFAVTYTAFDAAAGLGTGALIADGLTRPSGEQAAIAALVQEWFEHPVVGGAGALGLVGAAAWLTGSLATAVVLWSEQGARLASAALAVAGVLLALGHTPPFGPSAMLAVTTAMLLRSRPGRRSGRADRHTIPSA